MVFQNPDPFPPDQRVVLHGESWETDQGLLRSEESQRGSVRMTFDRGGPVLVRPSSWHERCADRLGSIIRLTAVGLGLTCLGVGRTTLTREDEGRGKEPDNAYYLTNEPRVRGKEIDFSIDPPPDLAVEIEITHHDPDIFGVYAALGVPEIWHSDGRNLRVLQLLPNGRYKEVAASPSLPALPRKEIPRWLERAESEGESEMTLAFLDWVRNDLAPGRAEEERNG